MPVRQARAPHPSGAKTRVSAAARPCRARPRTFVNVLCSRCCAITSSPAHLLQQQYSASLAYSLQTLASPRLALPRLATPRGVAPRPVSSRQVRGGLAHRRARLRASRVSPRGTPTTHRIPLSVTDTQSRGKPHATEQHATYSNSLHCIVYITSNPHLPHSANYVHAMFCVQSAFPAAIRPLFSLPSPSSRPAPRTCLLAFSSLCPCIQLPAAQLSRDGEATHRGVRTTVCNQTAAPCCSLALSKPLCTKKRSRHTRKQCHVCLYLQLNKNIEKIHSLNPSASSHFKGYPASVVARRRHSPPVQHVPQAWHPEPCRRRRVRR